MNMQDALEVLGNERIVGDLGKESESHRRVIFDKKTYFFTTDNEAQNDDCIRVNLKIMINFSGLICR